MYKIHSKLVFLKKINKKKGPRSARELHCSLFLTLNSAINVNSAKKARNRCFANTAFPTQKKGGIQ